MSLQWIVSKLEVRESLIDINAVIDFIARAGSGYSGKDGVRSGR